MTTPASHVPALPPVVRQVVDGLAGSPVVRSVRIAGSRARGRPTSPDSDWDILVYVEEVPSEAELRRLLPALPSGSEPVEIVTANLGHPFQESEFSVPVSPRIDVCLRPLANLEAERERADRGAFLVHSYPKIHSGVPSYILLSEAALSVSVHGEVGRPPCPVALRDNAAAWWRGRAACCLLLATDHVRAGETIGALGHVLAAATSLAHARLIGRGYWYPITKRLLDEPGALPDGARRGLEDLSAGLMTTASVDRIAGDMALDPEDGLEWLAQGRHMGVE
ncbi:nucleotidyltransferase domain-containing protein [Streptosporangium sp. NPDC000239]|uniref:nucleotidyltransferase family protein n=1 Tax=Streptosporangium sp. NPDC000239 TaxID=3154248 RepID=UPI00331B9EBF